MITLGVGDFGATNKPSDAVKTFALGSCVSIIFLFPKTRAVGMVHVALPDSSLSRAKAKERPGYFADTGIPALICEMKKTGYSGNGREMIVKLAGGAQIMDLNNTFNIGKRNVLAIKKLLWGHGMGALVEDVGGNYSRTVAVHVDTGKVTLSSPGRKNWEI